MKLEFDHVMIRTIGEIADANNTAVYAVGGCVRDYLLGNDIDDVDFTVVGDALEFAKKAARHFDVQPVVYERFGTALLPVGKYKLEFVGTRKEEYLPHSRKPLVTEGTLDDDLRRRDFTINAMAIGVNKHNFGEFLDYFGGVSDLEKKILRTPLEPEVTFSDDPLRMMRAARFAARLNFAVADNCIVAMKKMAERILIISQERITDELLKTIAANKPSIGLKILFETELLHYIFPELHNLAGVDLVQSGEQEYAHKDVFFHTLKVLDNIAPATDNIWLRFAVLMHDVAKPKTKKFIHGIGWTFHGHEEVGARWQKNIFRRMRLPMEHLPYVETLVRMHQRPMMLVDDGVTDSAVRRLAVQADDAINDLFALCRADITTKNPKKAEKYLRNYDKVFQKVLEVREKDNLRAFQSPVRGEEIMEICGIPPSRTVGYIKLQIEEAILEGIIPNEYSSAKIYFLDQKDAWMAAAASLEKPRTKTKENA